MHKKIIGNPVGIPSPHTDFNQTDPKKGDYLKGRDDLLKLINLSVVITDGVLILKQGE